jgi:hypothetical protein
MLKGPSWEFAKTEQVLVLYSNWMYPSHFAFPPAEYESPTEQECVSNRHTQSDRLHQCVCTVGQERIGGRVHKKKIRECHVSRYKQLFSWLISTFWRIACTRVILEKEIVDRLAKGFPAFFMEFVSWLPCTHSTVKQPNAVHTSHLISLIYTMCPGSVRTVFIKNTRHELFSKCHSCYSK